MVYLEYMVIRVYWILAYYKKKETSTLMKSFYSAKYFFDYLYRYVT